MSTRCNIRIVGKYGKDQLLYCHYDGYPSGVGKDLNELLSGEKFHTPTACRKFLCFNNENYKEVTLENDDIEFYYVINIDNKTVECSSCDYHGEPVHEIYTISWGKNVNFEDYNNEDN